MRLTTPASLKVRVTRARVLVGTVPAPTGSTPIPGPYRRSEISNCLSSKLYAQRMRSLPCSTPKMLSTSDLLLWPFLSREILSSTETSELSLGEDVQA